MSQCFCIAASYYAGDVDIGVRVARSREEKDGIVLQDVKSLTNANIGKLSSHQHFALTAFLALVESSEKKIPNLNFKIYLAFDFGKMVAAIVLNNSHFLDIFFD